MKKHKEKIQMAEIETLCSKMGALLDTFLKLKNDCYSSTKDITRSLLKIKDFLSIKCDDKKKKLHLFLYEKNFFEESLHFFSLGSIQEVELITELLTIWESALGVKDEEFGLLLIGEVNLLGRLSDLVGSRSLPMVTLVLSILTKVLKLDPKFKGSFDKCCLEKIESFLSHVEKADFALQAQFYQKYLFFLFFFSSHKSLSFINESPLSKLIWILQFLNKKRILLYSFEFEFLLCTNALIELLEEEEESLSFIQYPQAKELLNYCFFNLKNKDFEYKGLIIFLLNNLSLLFFDEMINLYKKKQIQTIFLECLGHQSLQEEMLSFFITLFQSEAIFQSIFENETTQIFSFLFRIFQNSFDKQNHSQIMDSLQLLSKILHNCQFFSWKNFILNNLGTFIFLFLISNLLMF